MSYQVLARKWRPRTFSDMVGQQHVVRALSNGLESGRLHHAFLFTGTRGVGKTTVARILAKCLNCDEGPTANPCGRCGACTEVDDGRFVDLIEVDAASRARVDETRELLDNVQYAPTRGRYKVYLIDEVHMFSKHSFNALLKTLEEPPPHVKFLLATTDPQRLPITVLSRCLQFNLRRLPAQLILSQLGTIATAELVHHDESSLALLARAADGSMRDALSLLDQAIAYGGGALEESDVRTMLGTIERRYILALLAALADQSAPALMATIDELAQSVPDFGQVLDEIEEALTRIAVVQAVPNAPLEDVEDEAYRQFVELITPELIQLYYQIALIGRRDLPLAPSPRSGFEMTMLRMLSFAPDGYGSGLPGGAFGESGTETPGGVVPAATGGNDGMDVCSASVEPDLDVGLEQSQGSSGASDAALSAPDLLNCSRYEAATGDSKNNLSGQPWEQVAGALEITGIARELAQNVGLVGVEGQVVRFVLDPSYSALSGGAAEATFLAALRKRFGSSLQLSIELAGHDLETTASQRARRTAEALATAATEIEEDQTVRAICERFEARVDPGSIRPRAPC